MSTPTAIPFTVLSLEPAAESWKLSLRARARVRIAEAVSVELELIEGRSGIFIAYPSRKEKRGAADVWVPILELADRDLEKAIFKAVREEFIRLEERAKATAAPPASEPEFPEPNDLPF